EQFAAKAGAELRIGQIRIRCEFAPDETNRAGRKFAIWILTLLQPAKSKRNLTPPDQPRLASLNLRGYITVAFQGGHIAAALRVAGLLYGGSDVGDIEAARRVIRPAGTAGLRDERRLQGSAVRCEEKGPTRVERLLRSGCFTEREAQLCSGEIMRINDNRGVRL